MRFFYYSGVLPHYDGQFTRGRQSRRAQNHSGPDYSVLYFGEAVEMPPKELELLYFLASSPNQVFTREQLLDHIWGYEYIGDTRTVDVHIKRLREKIKDHDTWRLSTVWGIGYKFEVK